MGKISRWKKQNDFKKTDPYAPYFDLIDDFDLVQSSFLTQYNLRINQEPDMSYAEFLNLVNGLLPETPLGHVISIRSEKNSEQLKSFNDQQHEMRNQWRRKVNNQMMDTMTDEDAMRATLELQAMFAKAYGQKEGS